MPTNLHAVQDHPAALLETLADASYSKPVAYATTGHVLRTAAGALKAYEADHGITFAALDNDALAALREAYRAGETAEIVFQVGDLLGLND